MRRTTYRLLVISSALFLLVVAASARTRPRYSDTLRVTTSNVAMSGDTAPEMLTGTVLETLVTVDGNGHIQPALATAWTSTNNGLRWEFTLRNGVTFHDGQPCTAAAIQRSFARLSSLPWRVRTTNDNVIFESDTAQPNLPALLSLPQYAVVATSSDGQSVGTGPFRMDKRIGPNFTLKAFDDYWGGRPFADGVELITSRASRDQMTDFSLDRSDVIEVSAEQVRHAQQERFRMVTSRDSQAVVIVIDSTKPELRDQRLREAIARAVDRAAIHNVIFQRQGEISASLLPNWLSGYAFLFDANQDVDRARQLRMEVGPISALGIAYDAASPVERLIAERMALNAHDAGINMQAIPSGSPGADLHIRTVALPSLSPAAALSGVADQVGLSSLAANANPTSMYANERALLQTYSVIPLVFVPRNTALKDRVRNWTTSAAGDWHFEDVWISPRARPEVRP